MFLLKAFSHQCSKVCRADGVSPLVVVPRNHLDEVVFGLAQHAGKRQVHRGAVRVAFEINADQWFVDRLQDALVARQLGGIPECLAQFIGGGHFFQLGGEVHHRHGRGGYSQGIPVEFALQVGDHQRNGLGCPGGGRDDVQRRCPRPPQVRVRHIQDLLVVGVGMDGGHESALDNVLVVYHLGSRRQAVGGAGGVRDHVVDLGVVLVVVHAHHDGDVFAFGWRGDDHLLRPAGGDMVDGAFDGLAFFIDSVLFDREEPGRTRSRSPRPGLSTGWLPGRSL